jgi:hypothetical protein
VLTLDLYPRGGRSDYTLYEDDGNTRRYQQGASASRPSACAAPAGKVALAPRGRQLRGPAGAARLCAARAGRQRLPSVSLATAYCGAADRAAFDSREGWYFDPRNVGHAACETGQDIRQPLRCRCSMRPAGLADDAFPAAPAGRAIAGRRMMVVNRHRKKWAIRWKTPSTTTRPPGSAPCAARPCRAAARMGDRLHERRLIDGIELAPRNDQHWKHGQIRDYEIYMGDNNGDWGTPSNAAS